MVSSAVLVGFIIAPAMLNLSVFATNCGFFRVKFLEYHHRDGPIEESTPYEREKDNRSCEEIFKIIFHRCFQGKARSYKLFCGNFCSKRRIRRSATSPVVDTTTQKPTVASPTISNSGSTTAGMTAFDILTNNMFLIVAVSVVIILCIIVIATIAILAKKRRNIVHRADIEVLQHNSPSNIPRTIEAAAQNCQDEDGIYSEILDDDPPDRNSVHAFQYSRPSQNASSVSRIIEAATQKGQGEDTVYSEIVDEHPNRLQTQGDDGADHIYAEVSKKGEKPKNLEYVELDLK